MSRTLSAGIVTAYGAAARGGYRGTYEQFCSDLAQLGDVLAEFLGFSVNVTTLGEGQSATASYSEGVLSLGIPKGDTGNGIQSIALLSTVGLVKTYRVTYTSGATFDFPVADGNGISGVTLNGDYTLTISFTDGTSWTSTSIRGATGATPNLSIGTVATLSPGASATAAITGTAENPVLSLGIPQGVPGEMTAASMAGTFSTATDYEAGDYVVYSGQLYKFTSDHDAGAWDANDVEAVGIADEVRDLNRHVSLFDDIPGTTQTVTFDASGNPVSIVHASGGSTVRTDTFVWGTNTVTETRTLADGRYITLTTNLATLVTTISDIQEGA